MRRGGGGKREERGGDDALLRDVVRGKGERVWGKGLGVRVCSVVVLHSTHTAHGPPLMGVAVGL